MSNIYDNWERLVDAVLDREELRRLALLSSRETSFNSSISSASNISAYNSLFITVLDYVPGSLTDRVIKAAGNTEIFKQECLKIKSKAEKLAGTLREVACVSNGSYDRPTRRIISDTELVLEKTLKLVMKCSRQGIKRVFNTIPADAFQKVSSLLENSTKDISWLISIFGSEANAKLRYPPITINKPILCLVWEQITTLYMGSMDSQSDAAASLASLARGSCRHRKLIIEEGGVSPLLKLVEEGNLEGQENAIRAIGWLVKNPENGQHIIDAGAPQVFVKMLKEGPTKVQADVAWAVSELAMHYPKCQNLFAQHDIVAVLVSHLAFETVYEVVSSNKAWQMEYPITKVHMKVMAARALWQLAKGNSTICFRIIESCAIPCFAFLLEEQVVHYCSMVLLEVIVMALKNAQLRRSALDPNSPNYKALVSQLHRVLKKFEDPELMIFCIMIFGHFATTLEEIDRNMMISPPLKLMSGNERKVSVEAWVVLFNLCSASYPAQDFYKCITDAGGVDVIINILYFGEDIIQHCALFLLCYITIHMLGIEQVTQERVLHALKWGSGLPSLSQVEALDQLLPNAIRMLDIRLNTNNIERFLFPSSHKAALPLLYKEEASRSERWVSWGFIWNARVPLTVKICCWHLCKEAFPNVVNLWMRACAEGMVCHFCKDEEEDALHVLLRCPVARLIWAMSNLPWKVIGECRENLENWMRVVVSKLSEQDSSLFLIILWSMWCNRNKLMMDGKCFSPLELIGLARSYWHSYRESGVESHIVGFGKKSPNY